MLVQPETLFRWHRPGFRLVRKAKSARPSAQPRISEVTRSLITTMATENCLWGAERIRGELLKLGIRVSKRTVQQDVVWRAIQVEAPTKGQAKGLPTCYPCHRGSYLQLGGREALVWTQGNAPTAVGGKDFFKEGKGIPHPLRLVRFAGHGAWEEGCGAVLGLTKMDWNNDSLYDRLPVTMEYANILARTLKRMAQIAPKPYEFRFFM